MTIIPSVGRRSLKMRTAIVLIYAVLILGSVTMIYPFLLMLAGSVKGSADIDRMDPFPQLLYSERIRFARFEEARYSYIRSLSAAYSRPLYRFNEATPPRDTRRAELQSFRRFLDERSARFPDHFWDAAEMYPIIRIAPRNYRRFRDEIMEECHTPDEYNRRYRGGIVSWNDFAGAYEDPVTKEFSYDRQDPLAVRYLEFKHSLPPEDRAYINMDGLYFNTMSTLPEVQSGRVRAARILAAKCPKGPEAVLWTEFVKHRLNCLFIKMDAEGMKMFAGYLKAKFPGGLAEMNRITETRHPSFERVTVGYGDLANSAFYILYMDFITNVCPPEHLIVDTPSTRYRDYLGNQTATAPFVAYDYAVFKEKEKPFLAEVLTRNYLAVIQYMALYGRAVVNTAVYVGLAILAALLVNPLAAYALSRFNLKSTYTILMMFLATMAFPGAVTMIPNFLLLKNLHLLNSFWALILPGVANGYAIFILKGFFDSIPREVYESAMIDGANEWTMFWRFTMALSKPILALITLGAFTSAYTAFMFALIICPDERMWTLMVWLYQLQQGAHQSIIYAALVLAAIPTILVFVFAQNTIMKGIVIPVEK